MTFIMLFKPLPKWHLICYFAFQMCPYMGVKIDDSSGNIGDSLVAAKILTRVCWQLVVEILDNRS